MAESAGLLGEALKDARHKLSVEKVGGIFVPLVVKTLRLWTPFAKKILKAIASSIGKELII